MKFPTTYSLLLGLSLWLPELYAQSSDSAEQAFKAQVAGRYAHYDVVAYQEKVLFTEMKTYVITYGITENMS